MRFWIPIFVTGLVLGSVETSIVATPGFWLLLLNWLGHTSSSDFGPISTTLSFAPFAIDPVIAFLAMFFLGRRFDVSLGFARAFAALLVGTAAETFGYLLVVAIYALGIGVFSEIQAVFAGDLVFDGFGTIRLTLVGFAGLAFPYFTRRHDNPLDRAST